MSPGVLPLVAMDANAPPGSGSNHVLPETNNLVIGCPKATRTPLHVGACVNLSPPESTPLAKAQNARSTPPHITKAMHVILGAISSRVSASFIPLSGLPDAEDTLAMTSWWWGEPDMAGGNQGHAKDTTILVDETKAEQKIAGRGKGVAEGEIRGDLMTEKRDSQ